MIFENPRQYEFEGVVRFLDGGMRVNRSEIQYSCSTWYLRPFELI